MNPPETPTKTKQEHILSVFRCVDRDDPNAQFWNHIDERMWRSGTWVYADDDEDDGARRSIDGKMNGGENEGWGLGSEDLRSSS